MVTISIRDNDTIQYKIAVKLNEFLGECGLKDIVQVVRGDKEKENTLDFSSIPLPLIVLEESGEVTYKEYQIPRKEDRIIFQNQKEFQGYPINYTSTLSISIYSKDMQQSSLIAVSISKFVKANRGVIPLAMSIVEDSEVIGVVNWLEQVTFLTDEVTFSHEPINETIVYKLKTDLEIKVDSWDLKEVEPMPIVKSVKVEVKSHGSDNKSSEMVTPYLLNREGC